MAGKPPENGWPITPDGRYFVVKGRLWRCSDPALSQEDKVRLTQELMKARRQIAVVKREGRGDAALHSARAEVDRLKIALGERGPVWWKDGKPDFNRYMAKNTPYVDWFESLPPE